MSMSNDKGGSKVDWDLFWGVVLFTFLFVVGYALQKAEPVRVSAGDKVAIANSTTGKESARPSGEINAKVENWAADVADRSEAARRLVELGLKAK